jgi:FkbM family methyltransferase
MTVRGRLARTVQDRMTPRLAAAVGSVCLTALARSRCRVRYDDGTWIHRYADGVLVDTRLGGGGRTPSGQDRHARDVFLHAYEPRTGDTIVDVGAGVGSEVRLFSRLTGPAGRVVSVEAHPRTYGCLVRTVTENALANVTTVQCAVVGRPGPVYLEDGREHFRNCLTQDSSAGVPVPGRTLDELVATLGLDRIDLLKMNIEGAERAVLAASARSLRLVRHLTVSCHDFRAAAAERAWQRTFRDVTQMLMAAGFTIRTRPGDRRAWIPYYVYAARPHAPQAGGDR